MHVCLCLCVHVWFSLGMCGQVWHTKTLVYVCVCVFVCVCANVHKRLHVRAHEHVFGYRNTVHAYVYISECVYISVSV